MTETDWDAIRIRALHRRTNSEIEVLTTGPKIEAESIARDIASAFRESDAFVDVRVTRRTETEIG